MARRYTGGFLSATEQVTDSNTANGVFTLAEAQEKTALGNFPTGRWTPQRSLRFRNSASAYLSRGASPTTSGDAKWTYSCWLKINPLLTTYIVSANGSSSGSRYEQSFIINSSGQFQAYGFSNASGYGWYKWSDQMFRDPSAWYHIVIWFDADNSDSTKRVRTWVNNKELTWGGGTADSGAGGNWSSFRYLNSSSAYIQCIGAGYQGGGAPVYFTDSYMSESYMVPTLLVPPSDFALTDPETGSWIPKKYTGSIPTNGWYLPFDDNTTLTYLGLNKGSGSNYLTYSEQFDHANWSKPAAPVAPTVTANTIANPVDGATTADTLNFSTSDTHPVYQQYTVNTLNGLSVTGSVYLKKNTGTTFNLQVSFFNAGGVLQDGYANITFSADGSTCTATPSSSFMTVGADQLSNGWFRVWARNTNVSGSTSTYIRVSVGQTGGASSVYAFGAQLNFGSYVAPYTTSAASAVVTDLTVNNFSLTNNSTYDSFVDVPGIASVSSRNDVGGVTRGNYAILNALTRPVGGGGAFTVGQCGMQCAMSYIGPDSTIAMSSGKWYWEVSPTGGTNAYNPRIGIVPTNHGTYTGTSVGDGAGTYGYASTGQKGSGGTYTSYGTAYNDSDSHTIGVALDMDNGKIWFSRDGVWQASGDPAAGTNPAYTSISGEYYASVGSGGSGGGLTVQFNFGQRAFAYTPPTGFKTLCTTNLPNPVIKKPADHFDIKTYTGNGTALTVGTTAKQPSNYQISRSLRFRKANSGYLSKPPLSVAGNQTTWTWSGWVKQTSFRTNGAQWLLTSGDPAAIATNYIMLSFSVNGFAGNKDQLQFYCVQSNSTIFQAASNTQFKSDNQWYHVLAAIDTTQANPSNRLKLYVNGTQITQFESGLTYPSLNASIPYINGVSFDSRIGSIVTYGNYDGNMTEINFVDGQALTPSSFGQFDALNNWVPKSYTGTYGTNGYYLPFNLQSQSTYAADFNGSTQYLTFADNAAWNFSGNYTLEAFFYVTTTSPTLQTITAQWVDSGGTDRATQFGVNSSAQLVGYGQYGANQYGVSSPSGSIKTNTWYHAALVVNGTTMSLYLNGRLQGSTTVSGSLNNSTAPMGVGGYGNGSWKLSGKLSNVRITNTAVYTSNFTPPTQGLTAISGTQLLTLQGSTIVDSSSNAFAVTNNGTVTTSATSSVFSDPSIAADASGNNNHWFLNNINVNTNGTTYDSMLDSPTDYEDGSGVIHGNYCVLSGNEYQTAAPTNGGLTLTNGFARGTLAIPSTGKWYWENYIGSSTNNSCGICPASSTLSASNGSGGFYAYHQSGNKYTAGNAAAYGASWGGGNIIGVAVDADAGTVTFYKDNVSQGVAFTGLDFSTPWLPLARPITSASTDINFGQRPFTYTPPTGHKTLNTKNFKNIGSYNLPDTFGNFVNTPDLVWTKARTGGAVSPRIYDTVRGPGYSIGTNSTGGSGAETNAGLSEFLPNGFNLVSPNGAAPYGLEDGYTYVAWCWNRGKIPGFDIVTYAGNSDNNRMIPHNLGQVPAMYVTKNLNGYNSANSFRDWAVYHKDCPTYTGNSRQGKQALWMHNADAAANGVGGFFNVATSSEFGPNQTSYDNVSGQSYIAYLWAEIPGFSKFGAYTNNNSTDGPFIYCGFRPRWIMVKCYSGYTDAGWVIKDSARETYNGGYNLLWAEQAATELTSAGVPLVVDILSNGFKIKSTNSNYNGSLGSYVYAAFAETPFKYANAR